MFFKITLARRSKDKNGESLTIIITRDVENLCRKCYM